MQDYAATPWLELGWRRWFGLLQLNFGGRAADYRDAAHGARNMGHEVARHGADHLLVSGDVSTYATDTEFRSVREALGASADSRQRCSVVPGNHDYFTPNAARSRRFERHFAHLLESDLPEYQREGPYPFVHLKGDAVAVVGLQSPRIMPFPGFSFGRIGAAQLSALDDLLADPRMQHRAVLVMVHHAPLDPRGRKDVPMRVIRGLHDADALLSRLKGPRFAVLHGHRHQRYHHEATATRPHLFCAGSSTQRGNEGYWVIDVHDGVISNASKHVPRLYPRVAQS